MNLGATNHASSNLAQIGTGLARPSHDTQVVFRALLDAMSRPGRVQTLPHQLLSALQSPAMGRALCATLLTLLDTESSLYIDPYYAARGTSEFLRFHTSMRSCSEAEEADFVLLPADQVEATIWQRLRYGSDESPQLGSTLLIEVPALLPSGQTTPDAVPVQLTGPGIRDTEWLCAAGLDITFWQARKSCEADYPLGIDLLLCCGDQLVALPRSTRILLEQ